MKMRRLGKSMMIGVVVGSLVAPSTLITYATPSSDELLEEQEALESDLAGLEAELTELLDNINSIETTIAEKEEAITLAGEEYELAVVEKEEQYEAMKIRIQYMYEQSTSTDMIESIIKSASIMDLLNKVEYVNSVYEYDKNMLETYEEAVEVVEETQVALEADLLELETLQVESDAQKAELATLIAEAEDSIEYLDGEIQAAIEAEEAEAERIRLEEEAAAAAAAAEAERIRLEEEAAAAAAAAAAAGDSSSDDDSSSGSTSTGTSSSLASSSSSAIVQAASSYIGVWYKWGGTSYTGIDCSGLTQAAYAAVGISIPRTANDQRTSGTVVGYSISDAQPGDIICYSGHVGIYIGDGYMIHAPSTGRQVCIQECWSSGFLCVVRY